MRTPDQVSTTPTDYDPINRLEKKISGDKIDLLCSQLIEKIGIKI